MISQGRCRLTITPFQRTMPIQNRDHLICETKIIETFN